MRCETCGGSNVTVVKFESVSEVTYRYCRQCEASTWYTTKGSVEVDNVLQLARTIEPSGRRQRGIAA